MPYTGGPRFTVEIVGASGGATFPPAAALGDDTANPTTTSVGAFVHWWDGATWDRAPGNSTTGALVNTELPAAALLADNTANPTVTATGNLTAAAQTVDLSDLQGCANVAIQTSGTWSATLVIEGTVDGTNWVSVSGLPINGSPTGSLAASFTVNTVWFVPASGLTGVRVRCSAYTSGTAVVTLQGAPAAGRAMVSLTDGGATASLSSSGYDADATTQSSTFLTVNAQMRAHNGANVDRWRNNHDITILGSSSRTATSSTTFTNFNGRGVVVVLDMTTVGTGSVTLSIEGQDAVSAKWVTLLTGVAVTTNSTNVYQANPSLAAVANLVAQTALPRLCRVTVTHNNANAAVYSVGACVVL
jgi:hypothetical protein